MNEVERLAIAESIRNTKAAYCRGVDCKDLDLLQSTFAKDAIADYSGALTDPNSGVEVQQASVGDVGKPICGGARIAKSIISAVAGMVTVHHCAVGEIHVDSPDRARAIWPMVDRLLMTGTGDVKEIIGYGFYHDTYVLEDNAWRIETIRLQRTRVDIIR